MHSGFVIMQDRLKFEIGRLHFGRHIAGMVLLLHLTKFLQISGHGQTCCFPEEHLSTFVAAVSRTWPMSQKKTSFQTGTFEKIEHQETVLTKIRVRFTQK